MHELLSQLLLLLLLLVTPRLLAVLGRRQAPRRTGNTADHDRTAATNSGVRLGSGQLALRRQTGAAQMREVRASLDERSVRLDGGAEVLVDHVALDLIDL